MRVRELVKKIKADLTKRVIHSNIKYMEDVIVTLKMPPDLKKKADRKAKEEERTISAVIRKLLKEWLEGK